MASKIGKKEWIALYVITGAVDAFQITIDLFFTEFLAAPEIANEFIDQAVGVGLLFYLQIRGVDMIHKVNRLLSLLCVDAADALTGGVASFWVLDVWYIHSDVKKEEAERLEQEQQQQLLQNIANQPLNADGVRLPQTRTANSYTGSEDGQTKTGNTPGATRTFNMRPLNVNGIRPPTGPIASVAGPSNTGTANSTQANKSTEKVRV